MPGTSSQTHHAAQGVLGAGRKGEELFKVGDVPSLVIAALGMENNLQAQPYCCSADRAQPGSWGDPSLSQVKGASPNPGAGLGMFAEPFA